MDNGLLVATATFAIATAAMWMANVVFWAVPPAYIKGNATAGAIALINTIGLSGGFWGPAIIGWAKTATGNMHLGFVIMAAMLLVSATLILLVRLHPEQSVSLNTARETLT
jgi:nitrate/nitrite transporter NarK